MKRKKILSIIYSLIITIFIIIGTSFILTGNFKSITKYPILFLISSGLLYKIINEITIYLYDKLDEKREKNLDIKKNKFNTLLKEKPFIFSLIFILLCWLIYLIAFYPGILSPDPSYQILQYFGIDNKYSYYSILIDKSVILTNHHPVIHTLLLGSCIKIGIKLFNSFNIGLFIYTLIQTFILAATLSYTIKFMKEINVNEKYRKLCLFIYALVPVFPLYALSPVKDVIFGCLIILYVISLYKFIKNNCSMKVKDIVREIILIILIMLFRNNGFHVVLLSFPFLFLTSKKNLKKYLLIFLVVISFYFSYNKVILPHFKITNGSIREMLSVPFQQTARYVKKHKNEVTKSEKKAIDKILDYDTINKRYNPKLADPVKNKFNRYYTNNDLKNYFKVWILELKKHPITYIEATINNTYGYFYPVETNWYVYIIPKKIVNDFGFNYSFNSLYILRYVLSAIALVFPYIPFIGLFVNIGFNTWILLFMLSYLLYKKNYKSIIYILPSLILLLVCFVSPANTYFRYALPNIFLMPTLFSMFIKEKR